MREPEELTPSEMRRLTPIAIDMIRDQLAPAQLRRGALETTFAETAPDEAWKLTAVLTYLGRALTRTVAEAWSTPNDGSRICTPEDVLNAVEKQALEGWSDV